MAVGMSQVGRVMRVTVNGEVKSRAPLSQRDLRWLAPALMGLLRRLPVTLTRASRKSDGPTEALSSDVWKNCFPG